MPGDRLDPITVDARRGLLDALDALGRHIDHIVLVGAQAIYLHTDEIVTGVALFTKDADIALIPPLNSEPDIEAAMRAAKFVPGPQPGIWLSGARQVDLLIPEGLSPPGGRRAARLPGHGPSSARRVPGIEGAAVDHSYRLVPALDPLDTRVVQVKVAGPAALLISKAYKLAEREAEHRQRRLENKDAFDAYRLLQLPTDALAQGCRQILAIPETRTVAEEGIEAIRRLFVDSEALGAKMAGRYVTGVGNPAVVQQSVALLASDLLAELDVAA